ncbi:MAG: hypothetical protein JNK05_13150 [Myxococcales bacterium]|nr:hypothetical protein [Myxococcales bacterium]
MTMLRFAMKARAAFVLGSVVWASGCPSPSSLPDAEPPIDRPPVDVVRDTTATDTSAVTDGAMDVDDASMDVAPVDATSNPDGAMDTSVADTGVLDAPSAIDGDLPEIIAPPSDVTRPGFCDMSTTMRACTMDAECDRPIERCLPTGCGSTMRCQRAGRRCRDNADCLAGSQTCTRGVCVATGTDCGDSRACPEGYGCEGSAGARACVNRRRNCDGTTVSCPFGGVCQGVPGLAPYCAGVTSRCASDDGCLLGSSCRDVDGDGARECVPSGPCGAGMCASSGDRCQILPVEYFLECGPRGICNPTLGCGAGYECVDVWSSGVFECRPTAEPCRTNAACPAGQLCFEAGGGGAPASPAGCR